MVPYRTAALEALADPTRRSIFELLGSGPRSVVEIAGDVPISRPAVSQHLKILKDAGLISVRAAGTRNIYRIDPAGLAAVRDYFDQFWAVALAGFAATVDSDVAESVAESVTGSTKAPIREERR